MAYTDAQATNNSSRSNKTYSDLNLNFTKNPATNDVARLNVQFQYRKWTNTSQLFGVGNVSSTTHPDPVNYNPSTGQFGT